MNPNDPTGPKGDPMGMGSGAGVLGSLIQVGAGLYNAREERKTAKRNTDLTIAHQKAEAELAYQREVQMWHMQNAYNSPEQQMARFGAAGLNPHLIYGQGNAGNASSVPQYTPAQGQYRYQHDSSGAVVGTALPILMQIGSWMQNMRLQETQIQKAQTDTERVEQLIAFLTQRNPQVLSEGANRLSIFPYQFDAQRWQTSMASAKFQDFVRETDWKWDRAKPYAENMLALQNQMQYLKNQQQKDLNKITGAKASWTDFNITDPQSLMSMLFQAVLGQAGMQLRLSRGKANPMATPGRTAPKSIKTYYNQSGKRRSQVVDYPE